MDDRPAAPPQVMFADAARSLETLREMVSVLSADVQHFQKGGSDLEKRAAVRAAFASIEGTCFALRSAAVHWATTFRIELTEGERLTAREVTYTVNDRGQVEESTVRIPTLHNVRFALVLFAKAINAEYEVPVGEDQYEKLKRSQRVRNRITHPRAVDDLRISDQEMNDMARAAQWFDDQVTKLLAVAGRRVMNALEAAFDPVLLDTARRPSGGYDPKVLSAGLDEAFRAKEPIAAVAVTSVASLLEEHRAALARIRAGLPAPRGSSDDTER